MDIDEPNIVETFGYKESNPSNLFGLLNPFG